MPSVERAGTVPQPRCRAYGPAVLLVGRGSNIGARFVIDKDVVEIGRHPDVDIVLDDVTVTGRHAELRRTTDGYQIADLGSLNGTYVNQERIHTATVGSGDDIQIGRFRLTFLPADPS